MEQPKTKKEIVLFFLKKGILLNPSILKRIEWGEDFEKLYDELTKEENDKKEESKDLNEAQDNKKTTLNVIYSHGEQSKKRSVQDFVAYFNSRYKVLENILRNRQELQNITSINRVLGKKDKENVAVIGLVKEKKNSQKGLLFEIEDPTGVIKVFIRKEKNEMFNHASDIVLDEVIGVVGTNGDKIIWASNILWPEVPLNKELKKTEDDIYAIFLSDIHVGSNNFLEEEFNQFLEWINGKTGSPEHKEIASKVRYLFVVGDLIDGMGVYPGQEKELTIKGVIQQYEECARLLKKVPSNIKIVICPGNHDALRLAEPQPALYKDFADDLWKMENVTLVSNPSYINFHFSETFPGFDVLLYHGYSFDYYVANVDSIRNNDGYNRADLIMKFLLQRRHLAPSYSSTLYVPEQRQDPLVITKIPDFFVTGHIHKSIAAKHKNITLICGSCWQSKTPFQEKVGHNPEPARVPVVNLKTREIKILKFTK